MTTKERSLIQYCIYDDSFYENFDFEREPEKFNVKKIKPYISKRKNWSKNKNFLSKTYDNVNYQLEQHFIFGKNVPKVIFVLSGHDYRYVTLFNYIRKLRMKQKLWE